MREPKPKTEAAVRSGVVVSLIEEMLESDEGLRASLPSGAYAVALSAPEGLRRKVSFNGGRSGVSLFFPRWQNMTSLLSGEKGTVIPLPSGTAFPKAVKAFQKAAGAVASAMGEKPVDGDVEGLEKKTRLLLTAALRGVCEVYNYDHWVDVKARNIPAGRIGVRVADRPDMCGVLTLDGKTMTLSRRDYTDRVNAVLEFRDPSVCYAVLTGAEPALGALGDGRVMIRGRLPMIQGLFPLLDRFGEIMG